MRITIVQDEIEEAVRDLILNRIQLKEDMQITVDLMATRGKDGITADIDISKVGSEPRARTEETPAPEPKTETKAAPKASPKTASAPATNEESADEEEAAEDVVEETEAEVAEEEPAQEEEAEPAPAPKKPAGSIFGNMKSK